MSSQKTWYHIKYCLHKTHTFIWMKGYISKRIVGRKSVTPGNNHLLPLSLLFTSNFILKISHQPSIVIQQQNSLPLFRHISQIIHSNSFHSKVVFVFPAYISDKIGFNLEFQIQSFEIKKKKKGGRFCQGIQLCVFGVHGTSFNSTSIAILIQDLDLELRPWIPIPTQPNSKQPNTPLGLLLWHILNFIMEY